MNQALLTISFVLLSTTLAGVLIILYLIRVLNDVDKERQMLADDCVKEIERHNKLFKKLDKIEKAIENGEKEKAHYKTILDAIKRELVNDSQSTN